MGDEMVDGDAVTRGAVPDAAFHLRLGSGTVDVPSGRIVALIGENRSGAHGLLRAVIDHIVRSEQRTPSRRGGPSGTSDGRSAPVRATGVRASGALLDEARVAVITRRSGISPAFDVTENVFLGDMVRRMLGPIPVGLDWPAMRARTAVLLGRVGSDLGATAPARALGELDRLRVELARAIQRDAGLLVLDEPTALLDHDDAESVIRVLDDVRDSGVAVLVLTQKPLDALGYADTVVVARDGEPVAVHPRAEWHTAGAASVRAAILSELVDRAASAPASEPAPARAPESAPAPGAATATAPEAATATAPGAATATAPGAATATAPGAATATAPGAATATAPGAATAHAPASAPASAPGAATAPPPARAPESAPASAAPPEERNELLRVSGWSTHDAVQPRRLVVDEADLVVHEGEIVGIAGLARSGGETLLLSVYGRSAGGDASGTVWMRGERVDTSTVEKSIAAGLFFAATDAPKYRMRFLGGISVPIAPGRVSGLARSGMVDVEETPSGGLGGSILGAVRSVSREGDAGARIRGLVQAFAASEREVLLLGEPLQGATAAERSALVADITRATAAGKGVVITSDDLESLRRLCDRIVVMAEGRVTGSLPSGAPTVDFAPLLAPN